jgi:amino acid adenylation domain-containing protein
MSKINETYPLSAIQKGMLFHSLEQSKTGVYLQQFICNLNENINIKAFEQAWQKIIERHTVLRTGFQWQDLNEPQQIVYKEVNCPLHFEDWSDISNPDHQLAAYLESDKKQGFDLTEAPLIRLALFKFSDNDYRFIWTHHHIILDGRSYFVLFKELFNIYNSFNENKDLELTKVYPYSEYIEWLQQQDFSKSEQFWRKSLSGVEAPTPLIKTVESIVEEEAYLEKTYDLSETLTKGLKFFAEQNGLTLNTLVQAAWAILLNRYSGEDKVIFGATRACRHWTKIEPNNRIGIFINIVPFCTMLDANMDVLTWLDSLRRHWVEMREHEHTPLTQIQQWSEIQSDSPLFESILVFENADLNSILRAQGEDWQKRNFTLLQTTNYPLVLAATVDSCLHLMLKYETARFDAGIINRMFGHLETILTNIIANPTQRLSEISLLTKAEQDQLLVEWNNTAADYPLDKCIHQLFEEQVEKTPDAIAVKFEDQQLTYSELNARANQVAHHLLSLGVKPDNLIGLSVERSLEMIVGILGILKAGAAYVPLDPSYPEERLNFILEDSGIEILLDKERLTQEFDQQNVENPSTAVQPNNIAYVIYTSGSTGKPKGVLIEHKSLVNHTLSARDEFELNQDDRVLQFASISFDAAAEEIYPCLITGATLVLRTNEMLNSISTFLQKCKSWGLTLIDLPTAYWHEITSQLNNDTIKFPSSVRLVIIGGEQALKEQLVKWQKYVNSTVKLFNTYGPTETTIVATRYLANHTSTSFSIGKPIANTQAYILDKNQNMVPQGVAGELHIGGIGLARGYLNRPELTAEKFIPLRFMTSFHSHSLSQRLYKTGDLVRYLPNGNIEFLGRIDNQVKIRGFRIELGEIESLLMQHPNVSEAAVIVREDQPGNKRIVAYTVGSSEDLRNFVKAELPNYMVPSAFVSLEKMPLTPNGKIDRRALPIPTETKTDSIIAPRDQLEQQLAEIWQQVLGVNSIGIHDNFFDLGGHSLLAINLLGKIEQVFDKTISVIKLFQAPTIAQFADILRDKDHKPSWRALLPIQTQGTRKPLFFIGSTDYARLLVPSLGNEQPIYGLNMFGLHSEGDTNPVLTVESMATEYLQEIRTVQPEGPYYLCGYCDDTKIAFEMAQQLKKQGQEVAYLGFIDVDWYANSSLTFDKRVSKLGKNLAKFGPNFITHKIQAKLKARKEAKILSKSEQEKQKYERSGESLPLQLQHQFLIKSFFKALDDYQSQAYSGDLSLLLSSELISEWDTDKSFSEQINSLVTGAVTVEEVPGFHDTLFIEPQVSKLGKQIKLHLESLN